jgi:hypothetical protein
LPAEQRAAKGGDHRLHRAELGAGLLGHEVAHRADHAAGDRVAQLLPHVEGVVDPFVAVPGGRRADAGRQRGRRVEPQVGEPQRFLDLVALDDGHGRVAGRGELAGCHLAGQIPVDRTAARCGEHLLQLSHELLHLLRVGGVGRLGARQGEAERDIRHESTVRAKSAPGPMAVSAQRELRVGG